LKEVPERKNRIICTVSAENSSRSLEKNAKQVYVI
jgi:hypothetical protein